MPPEHHTYNQSEIDRMHAIRTISDAEFLSDKGTEYVNDQLIVTPEQIAMAADKEAPRDKKVAAYALRDVLHVELEKTSADYECESTNRYNLSTEIEKVTEHYRGQHADKLPPVTSNKRSLFGDKLKTKIMTAKLRDAEEIIGSFDAKLKTTLSYTQGEKHNSLVKSVMQITDRVNPAYDPKYEPALEINYTHGKIDSINFYRLITGGTMFNAMLGDT
jgi:hypothetical protein